MFHKTVADWLTGVWQRRSIEMPDGTLDTTTQVIWLQTHSCYGDIRIPADRPFLRDRSSVHNLTFDEKLSLSQQQGFAGIAHLQEQTCQWHRYIDYQPFNGSRDIGTVYWEGDVLIEVGVDVPYKEEWQKIDNGHGDFTALVLLEGERWKGCIVTAGNYFVAVQGRSIALPEAESLAALLTTHQNDDPAQVNDLSCEISFGQCITEAGWWQIQRSTSPWREGRSLWEGSELAIDLAQDSVIQTAIADSTQRTWQIKEWGTGEVFRSV